MSLLHRFHVILVSGGLGIMQMLGRPMPRAGWMSRRSIGGIGVDPRQSPCSGGCLNLQDQSHGRSGASTWNVGKTMWKPWETLESLGAPELQKSVKPWTNPRKTLGEPWNGFWEHLGRGKTLESPLGTRGKTLGKHWETLEHLSNTLGNYGKPWTPPGKTVESTGC